MTKKPFEETVLEKLTNLQTGQTLMDKRLGSLEKGQTSTNKRLGSLEKGQASLEAGQMSFDKRLGTTQHTIEETVITTLLDLKQAVQQLENGQKILSAGQKGLSEGQKELREDVRRVELLQENMSDDITIVVEGVQSLNQKLDRKADKNDIADLKQDIQMIQIAVKTTNQDVQNTKTTFAKHLEAT